MRRRRGLPVFIAAVVAAMVLVGVGIDVATAADGRAKVRAFEEVQASDIVFERDSSDPSRGIFRVTTSEPMICAIVWGPDKKFGRFNNSLAMNGTGIAEHDVVLPDVEGGVSYRYVVQGTTADGTLYRSKVGRFELPKVAAASTRVEERRNVALDATVVDASSEFSAAFTSSNAIDGDATTEWSTKGDGDRGFITLDLGQSTTIAAVEFVTRSMPDGSAITKRYTVTVDDGPPLGPFRASTVAKPRASDLQVTGRVVTFDVASSTGGNVGAVEVRVYSAA